MTTITLPKPHSDKQRALIEHSGNVAALCGRRWGKTQAGVYRVLRGVTCKPGLYWWVGLTWRSASMKRAWRLLKHYTRRVWRALDEDPELHIREVDRELRFPGGGEVWLRTAERPDSLAGEGVWGAVLDEFTLMSEAVWAEFVAATLLDYGGWACFLGVPKGENWAANLWRAAATRPGWLQLHATSYDNPRIDPARIDEVRAGTSERVFRQEYLAEVNADFGAVFRNVTGCATAWAQDGALDGHDYTMGVDWARHGDFTALAVYDVTGGGMAALDRFTGIPYELQLGRLRALWERFGRPPILAEQNSMGGPLVEQLQREGLSVSGFQTTAESKLSLVESLTLAFERSEISILPDPALVGELLAYRAELLPSGRVRYSAPDGMHDDTVMALALAWRAACQAGPLFWE